MKSSVLSRGTLIGASFIIALSGLNGSRTWGRGNPFSGARHSQQATEERHLTAAVVPHSGMEVRTSFGSISIIADASLTEVEITARLQAHGATVEEAKANLAKITLKNERRSDHVLEIRAEFPKDSSGGYGCSFEVRTPAAEGVKARTSNGAVKINGLAGSANLESSFGSIRATDHRGSIEAQTANGAIQLEKIGGPVHARTSFGHVIVRIATGPVDIVNNNGAIDVTQVTESLQATTSFGSVTVHDIGGPVKVKSSNGAVTVAQAKGDVRASTSFGAVEVREAGGEADLETNNGSINYAAAQGNAKPFKIRTSFGSVDAHLSSSANGKIHTKTSFGQIKVGGSRSAATRAAEKSS